jgi:hypothetical protein
MPCIIPRRDSIKSFQLSKDYLQQNRGKTVPGRKITLKKRTVINLNELFMTDLVRQELFMKFESAIKLITLHQKITLILNKANSKKIINS